jgi:hypothetical protein
MTSTRLRKYSLFAVLALVAYFFADSSDAGVLFLALGHCDSMNGPVLKLARKALETGNVNYVLPWVRPMDEGAIRHAFEHALKVRSLGEEARSLADLHFFETLVRIHRAGEGEPYTGIKPAGHDLGPAIPAADRALEEGSDEAVARLLTEAVRHGVRERLRAAMSRKSFDVNDVAAGRRYVEAYVPYVHYIEKLWETAAAPALAHHAPHAAPPHAH